MAFSRPFDNVVQSIGNTPIVRLNRVAQGCAAQLYAKLEFVSPGGSIKDRIGAYLIEDAERRGWLKPGGTIVEGTAGNTGMALAIAAAIKGYKCVFVLPDKQSYDKVRMLRAFGAKVVVTPTAVDADDPRSYYSVSRRLGQEIENAWYVNQYDNLANRECHYLKTGPEILEQMPDLDAIVIGIGTGGTICGIGKYLKEKRPEVKVVAVDPIGSIVYDYFKTGKFTATPKTYKIEGIGEDFIPKNYDLTVIDDMVQVEDKESFLMTRDLLTKEGLFSGVSSGSAVVGALKWVKAQGEAFHGKKVLVLLPDSGNRYLSKVFDDDWMREAGFIERPSLGTVGDLLRARGPAQPLVMAKEQDKVLGVIERMKTLSISQLPVSDDAGWIKGVVTESALLSALYQGRAKPTDIIERLVDPSVEFVTPEDPVEKVSKLVTSGRTPVVNDPTRHGELLGIVTKIDLLTYLANRS